MIFLERKNGGDASVIRRCTLSAKFSCTSGKAGMLSGGFSLMSDLTLSYTCFSDQSKSSR